MSNSNLILKLPRKLAANLSNHCGLYVKDFPFLEEVWFHLFAAYNRSIQSSLTISKPSKSDISNILEILHGAQGKAASDFRKILNYMEQLEKNNE